VEVGGSVDDEAIALLMEFCKLTEKLELKAYPDPVNEDGLPVTVGYGSTKCINGVSLWQVGDKITESEANALLKRDAIEAYNPMSTIPYWDMMTAHQRAALADLNFNEGYIYGDGDHDTLDGVLRNRNWAEVGKALQLYDNNDVLGLSRRRYAEWLMFYYATTPQNAYSKAFGMESVESIMRAIA
jgi:GH24 family phage-related lysozyme (muramidase)